MYNKFKLALVVVLFAAGSLTQQAHAQLDRNWATAAFMSGYLGYKYVPQLYQTYFVAKPVVDTAKVSVEKITPVIAPALSVEYTMSMLGKIPWSAILLLYGFHSAYNKCNSPRNTVWDYIKPHMTTVYGSLAGAAALYLADTIAGSSTPAVAPVVTPIVTTP